VDASCQRAHIGDEPIVPRHQLIELSAGREILVLEARGLAGRWSAEQLGGDLVVDRREDISNPRKESRDRRKPVRDGVGARRVKRDGLAGPRNPIVTPSLRTAAARRPQLVAQMLFHERDFRLDCEDDITQPSRRSAVGGDARENPGAAFLVHDPARSVDGINEHAPLAVCFARAFGQHLYATANAFGD
jgi:hypothetical protein